MTLGRRAYPTSSRRPEACTQMMRSADRAAHHLPWRGRLVLAGLLLAVLLVLTAAAPVAVFAPRFQSAIVGPSSSEQAVANQSDPESGVSLITAVYNSLQD